MQSLRLPHTYRPPLLPAPSGPLPGLPGAAAALPPGLCSLCTAVSICHWRHTDSGAQAHRSPPVLRVHPRRWRVPASLRATRMHAGTSPVSAALKLGQARCTGRASPRGYTRTASRAALGTHPPPARVRGDALPSLPVLWWGSCCHIPEEEEQSVLTVCSPGSAAHFLPPPSSPLIVTSNE